MEGIIFVSAIGLIVVLVVNYVIADNFMTIAQDKGHNERKYFHFCFWLGIVGYLMVVALPDRRSHIPAPMAPAPAPQEPTYAPAPAPAPETQPTTYTGEFGGTTYASVGTYSLLCGRCSLWQSKNNRVCTQCGATFIQFIQS